MLTQNIKKRIAWILGTIIPCYLLLAITVLTDVKGKEFILSLSMLSLIFWMCILFLRLLYSEKSPLWNGIIAFLFWMPLAGWYWLEPSEEAIETGRIYAAIIEVLKVALSHGSIQFLGRWLITIRSRRANGSC